MPNPKITFIGAGSTVFTFIAARPTPVLGSEDMMKESVYGTDVSAV